MIGRSAAAPPAGKGDEMPADIAAETDTLRESPVFARLDAKRLRIVALT